MSLTYTQQAIDKRDARIRELEAEVAALKAERDGVAKTDPAPAPLEAHKPTPEVEVERHPRRR